MKKTKKAGCRHKDSVSPKAIKALDRSNMLGLLSDFPVQCRVAMEIARTAKILFTEKNFTRIAFCGLGGSAIGGDIVRSSLYFESALPIAVYREYELPASVDRSTLVFISSYSGNTEETISAYEQAKSRGCTLVAISSGGTLRECATRDSFTFFEIPKGLPPRCAVGYLSIIPLCFLARLGFIREVDATLIRMTDFLEDLRDNNLNPRVGEKDNVAKYVAHRLHNKFPVIYASSIHFDAVATRLRGQLNENAKVLASSHLLPEMNHNEVVGWQNPKKLFKDFIVLFLRSQTMHARVAKRMDITRDIIRKEGVQVIELWARGEDLLSNIFSLIYIGDFISYYLALSYGIDPTPVERVTYLKEQLAKGT